jgi:uncharacterized protein (UPF0332 family)
LTPESEELLSRADRNLVTAEQLLAAGFVAIAGREAYLASFYAAQAVIFDVARKVAKTHNGVHALFAELTRREQTLGAELGQRLRQSYRLKHDTDYGPRESVTEDESREALLGARDLVARIRRFLEAR